MITARITVRSNPRLLVPALMPAALVAGALALALVVHPLLGLVALIVSALFGYHLLRFTISQLRSYLAAGAEGVTVCELGESTDLYPWSEVTRFGVNTSADGDQLYVQIAAANRLISVSREFANFDQLLEEMQQHAAATNLVLEPGEELADRLLRLDAS